MMRLARRCLLITLLSIPFACQCLLAWESTTLINNGPSDEKVDLIFLGDGYTAEEMGKYKQDVDNAVQAFFSEPPFSLFRERFNVHRVDVISKESGTDNECQNKFVETALDTSIAPIDDCVFIGVLVANSEEKILEAAADAPAYDAGAGTIIVVVNIDYAGATALGGSYTLTPRTEFRGIALHEFGHSFGLLGDEYDFLSSNASETYQGPEPEPPNLTIQTDRSLIKWTHWIDPTTVIPTELNSCHVDGNCPLPNPYNGRDTPGLYEGGHAHNFGIYRPAYSSKMNDNNFNDPYESVNSEALVQRIVEFTREDTVAPTAPDTITVQPSPTSACFDVSWTQASDDTGIALYELQRSINGSDFEPIAVLSTLKTDSDRYSDCNIMGAGTYTYRVRGRDWTGHWGGRSTTNPIVMAPWGQALLLKDIQREPALLYGVDFQWNTDEPADSKIEYQEENSPKTYYRYVKEFSAYHVIELRSLKPDTLYHYKIISKNWNSYGEGGIEQDNGAFRTPPLDIVPPILNSYDIRTIVTPGSYDIRIVLETNEPTTVWLDYGPTKDYGLTRYDDRLHVNHDFSLWNVEPDKEYHFKFTLWDIGNNQWDSEDIIYRTPAMGQFVRADVDANGKIEITDAIVLLQHLFLGGQEPSCLKTADSDDSGSLDITDAVYILNHLFQGGNAPPAPFPASGSDPTGDSLTCVNYNPPAEGGGGGGGDGGVVNKNVHPDQLEALKAWPELQKMAAPFVVAQAQMADVAPNPFRPSQGHTQMTFANLPANSSIKIYTMAGEEIGELITDASGMAPWDGRNASGESVASGVYFVKANGKTFKVAVQR